MKIPDAPNESPDASGKRDTVVHLADQIAFDLSHGVSHMHKAGEHAVKLSQHLKKHPDIAARFKRLDLKTQIRQARTGQAKLARRPKKG